MISRLLIIFPFYTKKDSRFSNYGKFQKLLNAIWIFSDFEDVDNFRWFFMNFIRLSAKNLEIKFWIYDESFSRFFNFENFRNLNFIWFTDSEDLDGSPIIYDLHQIIREKFRNEHTRYLDILRFYKKVSRFSKISAIFIDYLYEFYRKIW